MIDIREEIQAQQLINAKWIFVTSIESDNRLGSLRLVDPITRESLLVLGYSNGQGWHEDGYGQVFPEPQGVLVVKRMEDDIDYPDIPTRLLALIDCMYRV